MEVEAARIGFFEVGESIGRKERGDSDGERQPNRRPNRIVEERYRRRIRSLITDMKTSVDF